MDKKKIWILVLGLMGSFGGFGQEMGCEELLEKIDTLFFRGKAIQAISLTSNAELKCLKSFGSKSYEYGKAKFFVGKGLLYKGAFYEAMIEFQSAKQSFSMSIGTSNRHYAELQINMAHTFKFLADFKNAFSQVDSALNILKTISDTTDILYGEGLYMKGNIFFATGNIQKALPLIFSSIKNAENQPPELGIESRLVRINMLALIYIQMGSFDKALPILLDLTKNWEILSGKESINYIAANSNLASVYGRIGDYNSAILSFEETLKLSKKVFGLNTPQYRNPLLNYGELKTRLGKLDEALKYQKSALEITKKIEGEKHPIIGLLYNNIGTILQTKGEYNEALLLYLSALEIFENAGISWAHYAETFGNIALIYNSLGNFEKSENILEELDSLINFEFKNNHAFHEFLLNNLAAIYLKNNQNDKAIKLLENLLPTIINSPLASPALKGNVYCNLGAGFMQQNELKEAESFIKKGIQIFEESDDTSSIFYYSHIGNYANLKRQLGQFGEANLLFEKARNYFVTQDDTLHNIYAKILEYYADYLKIRKDFLSSFKQYKKANNIHHHQISQNFTVLSETGKEAFIKSISENFETTKNFAYHHSDEIPEAKGLIYNDELVLRGLLLHSAQNVFQSIQASGNRQLLKQYENWKNHRQLLAHQMSLPVGERHFKQPTIDSLESVADDLEAELVRQSADFRAARQQVTWQQVRDSLQEKEVAIEFIHFRYRDKEWTDSTMYCALVLRKDDPFPQLIPLFEEAALQKWLYGMSGYPLEYTYLRSQPEQPPRAKDYSKLYRLIWQPLEPYLKEAKTIYYSPSGLLHRISIPAIRRSADSSLVDLYDLHYVSSTRELVMETEDLNSESIQSALVYGGIIYKTDSLKMAQGIGTIHKKFEKGGIRIDTLISGFASNNPKRRAGLTYLKGSEIELQQTERLLKNNQVFTMTFEGYEALEDGFKLLGIRYASPHILHIATHGFFEEDSTRNPLFCSGLYLAGADTVVRGHAPISVFEDGILHAYEVADVNLSNTKLVVLSACETGLGEIRGGEGVYGLQRAFKMAGANRLIMTLWKIPDAQTVEFMEFFYQHWFSGMDIRQAFLATQRAMKAKDPNPFYWGAFVLM